MNTPTIDLASWVEDRVPPDVLQICGFIWGYNDNLGVGPSWDEIAVFAGWKCQRSEMRHKMKRLRRWGVKWRLNVPGSTKVDKSIVPYLEAAHARYVQSTRS
jgi:hypothetical protein